MDELRQFLEENYEPIKAEIYGALPVDDIIQYVDEAEDRFAGKFINWCHYFTTFEPVLGIQLLDLIEARPHITNNLKLLGYLSIHRAATYTGIGNGVEALRCTSFGIRVARKFDDHYRAELDTRD